MLILIDIDKFDEKKIPGGNIIPFKAENKEMEYEDLVKFCQDILKKPLE